MNRPTITLRKAPAQDTWIVWRPGTSRVRKHHHTEADARAEAMRLSKLHVGARFYWCKAVGVAGPET